MTERTLKHAGSAIFFTGGETVNISVEISKSDNLGGNQNGIAANGTRQDQ